MLSVIVFFFFFQAEDGIRDLVRSRGLGDVYKRQGKTWARQQFPSFPISPFDMHRTSEIGSPASRRSADTSLWEDSCLLYTSDAADERSSVDLGGRRIIKKKKKRNNCG